MPLIYIVLLSSFTNTKILLQRHNFFIERRNYNMKNPNNYGGIVNLGKRRRKPFAVRITAGYTEEGKQIYKYLGYYERRQDAIIALAEYNRKPYSIDGRNKTFAEVYDLAKRMAFREASPQKIASYAAAFKKCQRLHQIKISQIHSAELQEVLDNCDVRSKSTLNNIKIIFHTVFKYAVQNDYIDKDYSQYVIIDNTAQKKDKSIFTDAEIETLWANSSDFCCKIALILIYTGFRISELLTLRPESVNLEDGYFRHGMKTKNGRDRIVPIHPRIRSFVCEFMENNTPYLISNPDRNSRKPLTSGSLRPLFSSSLAALGISHSFHECRHTTASLLNRYGAKELSIKRILGHSAGDLTKDVYTHVTLQELTAAINLIP